MDTAQVQGTVVYRIMKVAKSLSLFIHFHALLNFFSYMMVACVKVAIIFLLNYKLCAIFTRI